MKKITQKTITIEFNNPETAEHFATWLCESGEQEYWNWMEYREQEEEGNITAVEFRYHDKDGIFMGEPIIKTTSGRLDRKT